MERKNMVLLTVIAVATLLVAVVGATFAYFTATVNDQRSGGVNKGQADISSTAKIADTLTFATASDKAGSFTAEEVYPGHKEVAEIKVTAKGENGAKAGVAFKYNVTLNEFPEGSIKVSLYKKASTDGNSSFTITDGVNFFGCTKTSEDGADDGKTKLYESCTATATALNGASLVSGSEQNVQTTGNTFEIGRDTITVGATDTTVYYYVVVEFLNQDKDQNLTDMNKHLTGKIEVSAA